MSSKRPTFAWGTSPTGRLEPARAVAEALRVAADLYSTGYEPEGSYVAREAIVPLAQSTALTDALKWWSSLTRPAAAERDPALGDRLHRLAQDLVAGGYPEEAVRVVTTALRHLEEPPERTIAAVFPRLAEEPPGHGQGIYRPSAVDLAGRLEEEALAAIPQSVTEGIALLASSRRIAPARPWPTTLWGAVDLLPARSGRALPAAAVPALSKTAFELSWLGAYEPALNLGLLLPFERLGPYTAKGLRLDRWATQLPHRWSTIGRGLALEAMELSAELVRRGYPAEAAEVLAAALNLAGTEPEEPRAIWGDFQQEFVFSDLRPGRWSRTTTRVLRLFDRFRDPRIVLSKGLPTAAPPPPQASPREVEPPRAPAFHFTLSGSRSAAGRVEVGSDVDLAFRYDVPSLDMLVKVTGRTLDELRTIAGAIDLEIIPHGYRVTDGRRWGRADFSDARLREPVVFHLRAEDTPQDDAGVDVLFRVHGTLIYELLLEMPVVASLGAATEGVYQKEVPLDLDAMMEARERRRDYVACVSRSSRGFDITAHRGYEAPWFEQSVISETRLQSLLDQTSALLEPVANHRVFGRPEDENPLTVEVTEDTEPYLKQCVDRVLTAGWQIYDGLEQDAREGLGRLVKEIESLPPGARVSIWSNGCFLPWAILYPTKFNYAWSEELKAENRDVSRLWGYRFEIECLLRETPDGGDRGRGKRKTSPLYQNPFVTLCLNPDIDKEVPESDPYRPVRAHRNFFEEELTFEEKELREGYDEAVQVFQSKAGHDATFLYFYCHGRAAEPLGPHAHVEELQLEGRSSERGRRIDPNTFYTMPDRFRQRPVVFINACSAGAFSPLTFHSFLQAFRRNGAEGMVASFFPLPIKFAAAFGQEVMRRYMIGKPIGIVLLELRRELLARSNPLGLFYGLNCALDLRTERAA